MRRSRGALLCTVHVTYGSVCISVRLPTFGVDNLAIIYEYSAKRYELWYGGEAVVVWYYSKDHFCIERKCASPFAADTTGCAWRLRVDCRARIFEFVSQSLTAALNVHPSSTSSTSSPAWSCWRCQTVIQLQKALSGSDHKSQKMSKDRLIKASMATTKIFCV